MSNIKLGQIITEKQEKDAIHIAVAPIEAGESLKPGDHIGIIDNKARKSGKKIGIVDPFLKTDVEPGQSFWIFLYPNTVTSLRHDWEHPDFKVKSQEELDRETSIIYINNIAARLGLAYDSLIEMATDNVKHGKSFPDNTEEYKSVDWSEFWGHFEKVTGVSGYADSPFYCSC